MSSRCLTSLMWPGGSHSRGNAAGVQAVLGMARSSPRAACQGRCDDLRAALSVLLLLQHLAPGHHVKVVYHGLLPLQALCAEASHQLVACSCTPRLQLHPTVLSASSSTSAGTTLVGGVRRRCRACRAACCSRQQCCPAPAPRSQDSSMSNPRRPPAEALTWTSQGPQPHPACMAAAVSRHGAAKPQQPDRDLQAARCICRLPRRGTDRASSRHHLGAGAWPLAGASSEAGLGASRERWRLCAWPGRPPPSSEAAPRRGASAALCALAKGEARVRACRRAHAGSSCRVGSSCAAGPSWPVQPRWCKRR